MVDYALITKSILLFVWKASPTNLVPILKTLMPSNLLEDSLKIYHGRVSYFNSGNGDGDGDGDGIFICYVFIC